MHVLFYDTESTDLAASWGRILCASYADLDGNVFTHRRDSYTECMSNNIDDGPLLADVKTTLESADMIVGWNSILHDIPLLNARLAANGMDPIRTGEKYGVRHLDLMWYAGGQSMKIGGRKLDTVAKFFQCENQKTGLDGETWQLAAAGNTDAMDSIVEHCEADVLVLRDVWPHLAPHVKKFQFSLSEVWTGLADIPSRFG